jgi:hypothetical protein
VRDSSSEPSYVAAMAVLVIINAAILIHLIPILFQTVWQIMPGVVILIVIVSVLQGMIKRLLE